MLSRLEYISEVCLNPKFTEKINQIGLSNPPFLINGMQIAGTQPEILKSQFIQTFNKTKKSPLSWADLKRSFQKLVIFLFLSAMNST